MAERIEDLLHRRSDLSTFLVHLTRDRPGTAARDALLKILVEQQLRAVTAMGMAAQHAHLSEEFAASQRVVCFTETPLEHVWMMCREIQGREVQMQPYGVAVTKTWARRKGVNPIMYLDITVGHGDWLTVPINAMVAAAVASEAVRWNTTTLSWEKVGLLDAPITKIAPFFEQMGSPGETKKEWWWEREWRHQGDLSFYPWDLVAVLVPEGDHLAFIAAYEEAMAAVNHALPPGGLRLLDPRWGQERMIAALAGVPPNDIGPFPG